MEDLRMQEVYSLDYTVRPTAVVRFSLSGEDLDPDKITVALGVEPHEGWKKGEKVATLKESGFKPRSSRMFGRWSLVPNCSKYDNFETQINNLLDMLMILPPVINDLIEQYAGEIKIGYSSGESNFGFHLDRDLLRRLSRLGVSLDFDIYSIHEHDDTD
jgi:hypothetical protein